MVTVAVTHRNICSYMLYFVLLLSVGRGETFFGIDGLRYPPSFRERNKTTELRRLLAAGTRRGARRERQATLVARLSHQNPLQAVVEERPLNMLYNICP